MDVVVFVLMIGVLSPRQLLLPCLAIMRLGRAVIGCLVRDHCIGGSRGITGVELIMTTIIGGSSLLVQPHIVSR